MDKDNGTLWVLPTVSCTKLTFELFKYLLLVINIAYPVQKCLGLTKLLLNSYLQSIVTLAVLCLI